MQEQGLRRVRVRWMPGLLGRGHVTLRVDAGCQARRRWRLQGMLGYSRSGPAVVRLPGLCKQGVALRSMSVDADSEQQ